MTTVFSSPTYTECASRTNSASFDSRKRERQAPVRSRGRARGTRAESGPSEPILSDNDAETSEAREAGSQHFESSESGDNDAGSGSESGDADAEEGSKAESGDGSGLDSDLDSDSYADRDSAAEFAPPRKRTKKASRS
ncbi:uncharacterized protein LOC114264755 [Camellia sinensis]|uniref:uncharacterized protein LOC114264755 n=1 Tax=Camellia sinensis TaxID=4442 RepID=UPI001035EA21|nr:uncharacterized protein LOC114264755 [Camellia sinensis]